MTNRRWFLRLGLLAAVGSAASVVISLWIWDGRDDKIPRGQALALNDLNRVCNLVLDLPADVPIRYDHFEEGIRLKPARRPNDDGYNLGINYTTPGRDTGLPDNIRSFAIVDSVTGVVIDSRYANSSDQALITEVLVGVRVEPLNPQTAPWPYSGAEPASGSRVEHAGFTLLLPKAGSGLSLATLGDDLLLQNCRSKMVIQISEGPDGPRVVVDQRRTKVHADDLAAFDQFLGEVKVDLTAKSRQ
jgi:hypothetical protein